MGGGSPSVGSSLLGDQKGLIAEITRQIRGEPTKSANPNNPLTMGAPQYTGPLQGKLPKGMDNLASTANTISPTMNLQTSMNALSPSLSGTPAYNFKNLSSGPALNMPTLQANGALAPQTSTYNYKPAQVASTLDNKNFTTDYFNNAIKAPLLNTYNTDIAPKIQDAAASAGSTFSTRTTLSKQKALSDLQAQMAAQLSTAARQDSIEKSQQDLASQQFNVQSGMQNAQFGAGQNLDYSKMNSLNQQMLNQQNSSNTLQQQGINNQNRLQYDTLNTNANIGLGENARANQMQSAMLAQQVGAQPYANALAGEQLLAPLQAYNNAGAQGQYQQWENQQAYNNPWLKLAMATAGLNPQSYVQQNPTAFQSAGQALGLGAAGLSAASSLGNLGAGLGLGGVTGAGAGMLASGALSAGSLAAADATASAAGSELFASLAPLLLAF